MEVTAKLSAPVALLREENPIPYEQEAGWAPQPVSTSEIKKTYLLSRPYFEPQISQPVAP